MIALVLEISEIIFNLGTQVGIVLPSSKHFNLRVYQINAATLS